MSSIDLTTIFLVAFLGSIGHCIGMCGGFIMAYSSAKITPESSKLSQSYAHLLYNVGRVTSYIILGAIFGAIGQIFSFTLMVKGIIFILVGIFMVLLGLSLMGYLKFTTLIESEAANSNLFKRAFSKVLRSKSMFSFYLLGLLNGFIPCGFVYFFLAFAVASASAVNGALIMAIFGLATVPILFSLGFFVGIFQKLKFRTVAMKIAALLVIVYGVFTGVKGVIMIKNPDMIKSKMMHMKKELKQQMND